MLKLLVRLIALMFAALLTACNSSRAPQEFKSEAGAFSVTTPVGLRAATQSVDTQAGKLEIHTFFGQQGATGYMVGYVDYPQEVVQQGDPAKILDGSRDGAVSNVNGKLVIETKVTLDGHPGRELVIDAKARNGEDGTVRARVFLVNNRLYQVMIVAPKGRVSSSAMNDFLQSFKLLGR